MTYFKTPADVAEELGLHEATVRRLARQFRTFTKVGGRVMFTSDDVEALINLIRNPPQVEMYLADGTQDPFAPNVSMPRLGK